MQEFGESTRTGAKLLVTHYDRADLYTGTGAQPTQFYLGVSNAFDKEPPFFATSSSGIQGLDTIPDYYDVFGRSYFAGLKVGL